jgi:hypothetical protein
MRISLCVYWKLRLRLSVAIIEACKIFRFPQYALINAIIAWGNKINEEFRVRPVYFCIEKIFWLASLALERLWELSSLINYSVLLTSRELIEHSLFPCLQRKRDRSSLLSSALSLCVLRSVLQLPWENFRILLKRGTQISHTINITNQLFSIISCALIVKYSL